MFQALLSCVVKVFADWVAAQDTVCLQWGRCLATSHLHAVHVHGSLDLAPIDIKVELVLGWPRRCCAVADLFCYCDWYAVQRVHVAGIVCRDCVLAQLLPLLCDLASCKVHRGCHRKCTI